MSKRKKQADRSEESEPSRPVQTEIPGTERPAIPELDEAAEEYVKARDKRMSLTEKEVTAKQNLIVLLKSHEKRGELRRNSDNVLVYAYRDMRVTLAPKDEVLKVKHVDDEEVNVGSAPHDDSEG